MAGKGDRYERELRDFFYDRDGGAIRIPASGAANDDELPDIFGRANGEMWACELKYTSDTYARFDKQEIHELLHFSNIWEANPVLIVRFSYEKRFWAFPFQDMRNFTQWKDQKTVSFHREKKENIQLLEEVIEGKDNG